MLRPRTPQLFTCFAFRACVRILAFASSVAALAAVPAVLAIAAPTGRGAPAELVRNGGFEGGSGSDGRGGGVPEWQPWGLGYAVDRREHRSGDQCIRCDSLDPKAVHGAMQTLLLNQARPGPVEVSGWSKADQAEGGKPEDYSIYVDCVYADGKPLWGQISPFDAGTHGWQRRQVLILPQKPIRSLTVYALFRYHTGTAWFDDFTAHEVEGAAIFDGQPLELPHRAGSAGELRTVGAGGLELRIGHRGAFRALLVHGRRVSGAAGGFYVRDVASGGPLVPMEGPVETRRSGGLNLGAASGALRLVFNAAIYPLADGLQVDGEVDDLTKTDRAITVYLCLPVDALGWTWGQDIRAPDQVSAGREYTNQVHVDVGATGGLSLYPMGEVADGQGGVAILDQLDWPSVYRIFYNSAARQLVMAWDFALTGKTSVWPSHTARFRCTLEALPAGPPDWAFRQAALALYRANPDRFERRAKQDGIWMPFTDPSTVQRPEDFGFAYHEGDNSVKSDNRVGILCFRYTEPSTYWMPMPKSVPRSYTDAMALVQDQAAGSAGSKETAADWARAVLDSGSEDAQGRFNAEFRDEPWTDGCVFTLDCNPLLPASPGRPTKASLSYTLPYAEQRYSPAATAAQGRLDGEYLDSLESWADVENFRPESLRACPYPIPYDSSSYAPVMPQWYSVHAFTRFLSEDLHNRGRLLMANTTPVRFSILSPLLDVSGIEVNWLGEDGSYQPDSDAIFNLRRTMSDTKPYLLLMNTDYNRFDHAMVEKYFQRCLFYGVFPSMFSADAADHPYWENPAWYNRDRDLFRKYIPLIKQVSAAGWQPIPDARAADGRIRIERWGARLFTVFNPTQAPIATTVRIKTTAAASTARDLVSGQAISAASSGGALDVPVTLAGQGVALLELGR